VIVCGEAISLRKSRSTKSKTTHRSEKADSDCGRSTCSGCTSPSLPVSPHLCGLGQRSRHLVVRFVLVRFGCGEPSVSMLRGRRGGAREEGRVERGGRGAEEEEDRPCQGRSAAATPRGS